MREALVLFTDFIYSSVFIHMKNIQSLTIAMFLNSRNLSPPIMNDFFTQKDHSWYNLNNFFNFQDC